MTEYEKQYKNQFVKVSDDFIVNITPKVGCSSVILQTLSYNLNIDINTFNKSIDRHINIAGYDLSKKYNKSMFDLGREYCVNENIKDKEKVCVIYRDPVKRYLSAWQTWCAMFYNIPLFNHIELIRDCLNKQMEDEHYVPQHKFFNFDNVDIFIKLEDYPDFCRENNIPWIMANKNVNSDYMNFKVSESICDKIKALYKDDYDIINKIINSNKLYERR